ncbi:MAG: SGNH/GDSL hydrolase family protein [Ilumatobacter sp.]|nr:SGNH/GDSL hydrolase family protein [Ilumatobacter sp.]
MQQSSRQGRARRAPIWIVMAIVATAISVVAATGHGEPVEAAPIETVRSNAGPLGPITVIGDSVMLGSLAYGPDLTQRLVEQGWGPVRARAGEGYSTGYFPVDSSYRASYWINVWKSQGWDPAAVVVNFGANDVGLCQYRPESLDQCSYNAIKHLVDALGPGKRIWWPKITRFPLNRPSMDAWNAALDRMAAEHPDFHTWDWPSVMYATGNYSGDHTHLSPTGYRNRSLWMAQEITASLARATQVGAAAPLPSPSGAVSEMVPIGPTRVLDTRTDPPGRLAPGQTIEVDVSDVVPPDATAVAAYITAAGVGGAGHLGANACAPGIESTSFTNYTAGDRGAVTITPLTADKKFCVYTHAAADVIVDVQAAFVVDGLRFSPLPTLQRLVDTRDTAASQHLELTVPAGAEAVAVNITAVLGSAPGHVTAHPCLDPVPTTATLNYLPGEIIASSAYIPVSDEGTICLDAFSLVDLVVDLTGTFAPDGALAFQPAVPTRMVDTRDATGGWYPVHGLGQTLDVTVAPPGAKAVTGTITLVAPMRTSHLQAWSCGEQPENSNVNALAGRVLANFVTTGTTPEGKLCIFAINTGQTLFDTTGWWVE